MSPWPATPHSSGVPRPELPGLPAAHMATWALISVRFRGFGPGSLWRGTRPRRPGPRTCLRGRRSRLSFPSWPHEPQIGGRRGLCARGRCLRPSRRPCTHPSQTLQQLTNNNKFKHKLLALGFDQVSAGGRMKHYDHAHATGLTLHAPGALQQRSNSCSKHPLHPESDASLRSAVGCALLRSSSNLQAKTDPTQHSSNMEG